MAEVSGDRSSESPSDLHDLLVSAPVTEKKLLELAVTWPGIAPDLARWADTVRLFVVTWDPLEWQAGRPAACATVNVEPPEAELVVYVPCWRLDQVPAAGSDAVATTLGALAGSAVLTAAAHEQLVLAGEYPRLVVAGAAPDLLADRAAGAALGTPRLRLVSAGWEDIGLGAITDIVQQAFGPVALDRSSVELAATASPERGCPACAGRRFEFPADLGESQGSMCPPHRHQARAVTNRRLAWANASNPDGWGAIGVACLRQERPHLPNGLAGRLPHADASLHLIPSRDELADRARCVVGAADWFEGRPGDLALALGQDPDMGGGLPDWLVNLVMDLGHAGLGDEVAAVGQALTRIDPESQAFYDADVAVALAQSGLGDRARAQVAANLTRWPDDFWVRIHAGDALAALEDRDTARAHFQAALDLAEATGDVEIRSDAVQRLRSLDRGTPGQRAKGRGQRAQPRHKPSRAARRRHRR